MVRPLRSLSVIPDHPHHLVLRGNNRRNIFSSDDERLLFSRFLAEALQATRCVLHNIALVTNHIHLLFAPPLAAALSRCIQLVSQRYAARRNLRRGASGKLFEQRCWARPVTSERQVAIASAYVDLNPQRAGVSSRQLKWSTHDLYETDAYRGILAELCVPSAWYLGLSSDAAERRSTYRAWLSRYLEHSEQLHDENKFAPPPHRPAYQPGKKRFERPDRSSAL